MTATSAPDPDDGPWFDEIDCLECLPPELKAVFRIGQFLPPDPPPDGEWYSDMSEPGDPDE